MDAVINEIRENDFTKGRHIVITPDAHALSAEKVIFERLGICGSMTIEVAAFSRLAYKMLGSSVKKTLSKQGAVLFFKKAIKAVQDDLKHYSRASKTDGFAGEMYAVIASIRNNGVTENDLAEAILKLDGTTKDKAEDILLLYRKYMEMLEAEHTDSTSRLLAFKDICKDDDRIKEAHFYLYGFDSLSKIQIEIITELARYAGSVTIGMVKDARNPFYPEEVFTRLVDHLSLYGAKKSIVNVPNEKIIEPFATLHDNVFTLSNVRVNPRGRVVLFKETNAYEQYNAVAREIIRLVRRENYRYKDVAIIDCAGDPVDFKEILERYEIPYFMDERYNLTGSAVYNFIFAILEVARWNFKLDKVRTLIKSPLFLKDGEQIADFENFILEKNLNYGDFKEPLEGEREIIRAKLERICKPFQDAKKIKDFTRAIKEVLSAELKVEFLEDLMELPEFYSINEQSWDRVLEILEEYERLIGEEEESITEFAKTFSASCQAEEIAVIPRFLDAVFIGTLRESCIIKQKAIFVLGATSTALPSDQGYQAIISALDLEKMQKSGILLYPAPLDRIREERFAFIDLLTKTEKLYIGYPENDFDATQNKPSQAIKDFSEAFKGYAESEVKSLNAKFLKDALNSKEGLEDVVGHKNNAFYTLLTAKGKIDEDGEARMYATLTDEEKALVGRKSEQIKEVPLGYTFYEKNKHTSISQIEQYFSCPYRHYLQYGLKLIDRQEGVLKVTDVGTLVHEVLERYFEKTKGKLRAMTKEEREAVAEEATSETFDSEGIRYLKNDPTVAYLIRRMRLESKKTALDLTDNVLKGSFDPAYMETYFGSSKDGKEVSFKTSIGEVAFHGKIDRIDVAKIGDETYAIAIDYKTGKIEADLHSVYYGEKIQLYLYLMAISKVLGLKPAGSFYLPIRSGYSRKGKSYRFQGQFIFSNDMLKALDAEAHLKALESGVKTTSDVIPINFTIKDGNLTSSSTKNKVSEEELLALMRYVETIIPMAMEEIIEGNVEKSPLGEKCAGCQYKAICGGCAEDDTRELKVANNPLKVVYPEEGGEE